ncbi:MAG: DNA topoisomerase III, partial [Methylococcaceae bacterium NSP1-2]
PKPYNEATLLGMMESAGKTCDDEILKEALKEKGLGTPATRASIIETLITRHYIQRQKKNLISTESGRQLISLISNDSLKSAALTGEWEAKLKKIEHNDYDPDVFMAEIREFTQKIREEADKPLYDAAIVHCVSSRLSKAEKATAVVLGKTAVRLCYGNSFTAYRLIKTSLGSYCKTSAH